MGGENIIFCKGDEFSMTYYNTVIEVLKSNSRFFTENGELLRNAVYEAAMQMDASLIKALYNNTETKKRFFTPYACFRVAKNSYLQMYVFLY